MRQIILCPGVNPWASSLRSQIKTMDTSSMDEQFIGRISCWRVYKEKADLTQKDPNAEEKETSADTGRLKCSLLLNAPWCCRYESSETWCRISLWCEIDVKYSILIEYLNLFIYKCIKMYIFILRLLQFFLFSQSFFLLSPYIVQKMLY